MDFKLIFFIIAGFACGVYVLLSANPIRALMILMCLFYVFPTGWIFYHYTGLLLVDFPVIAAIVLAVASGHRVRFFFKELAPTTLFLMLWMCVTSMQALEPGWGYAQVSKWLRAYLIFVCLANFIKTEKDLKLMVFVVLGGFAFESFIGFYQWRFGTLGLWFLGERLIRPEWWRAYGTFFVPSFFGNYLIMILPIALRLLIFYRPPQKAETYYYAGAIGIGMVALYATLARGPWISLGIVVLIMMLFTFFKAKMRPKVKWPIAVGIFLGLVFALKYAPVIIDQFGEHRKQAALSRIYLGQVAMRLIEDNQLFGVGPGNYELNSPRYVIPIEEYPTEHLSEMVHNSYLLIWSENGIPGLVFFVGVLLQMTTRAIRLFRSNNKFLLNIAIAIFLSLLAICVSYLASPDIHNEGTLNQIYLLAGLVYAGELIERRHRAALRKLQKQQQRSVAMANRTAAGQGIDQLSKANLDRLKSPLNFRDKTGTLTPRPPLGGKT